MENKLTVKLTLNPAFIFQMKSKRGPLRADVAWSVMWQEVPTSPARQEEEGIHLSAASPLTHHIPIIAGGRGFNY